MVNKKGWIEIVEAFVAILLVAGVLLILVRTTQTGRQDISERVYETQISILREIETNDTLRDDISDAAGPLPIEWENSRFPMIVKDKITERTPDYLDCIAKICAPTQICILEETGDKDVYSQGVTISTTLEGEVFRRLNLFCWTK